MVSKQGKLVQGLKILHEIGSKLTSMLLIDYPVHSN